MALDSIIIDNTVFNFFLKIQDIDLSNILRNIISGKVLIPSEIVHEMNNIAIKHPEYIEQLESFKNQIESNFFFIHCHSYDSMVLEFAKEHIDKGEAEAVAQCVKRRIQYFITDDTKCLPFISNNYQGININSTFFLIAIADLHGLLKDYKKVFREYHRILNYTKMRPSKKKEHQQKLATEYTKAMNLFNLTENTEFVSRKTNIEKILAKNIHR